jgi:hypothetical protein
MFGKDPRDQIIQDQRAEIATLHAKIIALVDAKAATVLAYQERMTVRERSDPNAMPKIPTTVNVHGAPKVTFYDSDESLEAAFRGK